MIQKVGFIGLGIMGRPMAQNLLNAGFSVWVFNRNKKPVEDLVRGGAHPSRSPRDVARQVEVVITMLPDSSDVEKVILGREGVIQGAQPGSLVIDMSSINPFVTVRIAQKLKAKQVDMLDAPVSGGDVGAAHGTLSIMVGGEEITFNLCLPIFQAMGKTISHVGRIGAGGYVKLVHQLMGALSLAAIGEAFSFGVKAGLDPQVIFQTVKGGMVGSPLLEAKVPMILKRNFKPGFKARLHYKDVNNALSVANELGIPLPFSSLVQQIFVALLADGKGEQDNSIIVTFFEKMARVELRANFHPPTSYKGKEVKRDNKSRFS